MTEQNRSNELKVDSVEKGYYEYSRHKAPPPEQQLRDAQEIARVGHWEFDLLTEKAKWRSVDIFH